MWYPIIVGDNMKEQEEASKAIKSYFDNLKFIDDEDIKKMNFYEACLYLEKLNVLDEFIKDGDNDEWSNRYKLSNF